MDTLGSLKNLPLSASQSTQLLGGLATIVPEPVDALVSHYNIRPTVDIYATTAAHYRALVMSAASMGTAGAQALYPSSGGPYRNDRTNLNPQTAPSRWDRAHFHRSGTRGRQGLGASPLHPEVPGNLTR
jgi:hypothetical protein